MLHGGSDVYGWGLYIEKYPPPPREEYQRMPLGRGNIRQGKKKGGNVKGKVEMQKGGKKKGRKKKLERES
jgi:hypothetical protein